jgi:PAS domain S-box-containing protein
MEEGVVFHDQGGVIRACNPSSERILRVPANRLLGRRSVLELSEPVTEDGHTFSLENCPALVSLRTRRSQSGVVIGIRNAVGATAWLSFSSHPLATADGTRAGVVTSFRDISDLREREQQNLTRTNEARDNVRLHDEFLATAAHELRTPLTALRLQMQNLIRATYSAIIQTPDVLRSKLEASVRQTERLSTLIDLLLDVSRITSGRLELETEELNLAQLVEDVIARNAEALSAAHVTAQVDVQPVFGAWDPARIEQVISNLLSNALKYGNGKPIQVEVREADGMARLSFADTGLGIAPQDQRRIFDRFERAHRDYHQPGLGLGLWVVREIVEAHGGRIDLASAPGKGSTFSVFLPSTRRGASP